MNFLENSEFFCHGSSNDHWNSSKRKNGNVLKLEGKKTTKKQKKQTVEMYEAEKEKS